MWVEKNKWPTRRGPPTEAAQPAPECRDPEAGEFELWNDKNASPVASFAMIGCLSSSLTYGGE